MYSWRRRRRGGGQRSRAKGCLLLVLLVIVVLIVLSLMFGGFQKGTRSSGGLGPPGAVCMACTSAVLTSGSS
jgi:hypothetical protein